MEKTVKKSRKAVTTLLPDDIIMQILSRLPAERVMKYRRVCRRWKDLISSQWFADMQLKSNISPTILFQKAGKLFLVDKWETSQKRTKIRKFSLKSKPSENRFAYRFILSYNGLIILKAEDSDRNLTDFFIVNPITGRKGSIKNRIPVVGRGDIYGLFYHPEFKEYCIIWGWSQYGPAQKLIVIGLESKPSCGVIKLPELPQSFWLPKAPISGATPVVIDEDATVYWILEDMFEFFRPLPCDKMIVGFDIKKEQTFMIPHPGPTTMDCYSELRHLNMNILKMHGRLSFVHSSYGTGPVHINIWSLHHSTTRFWIKSHSICIDECMKHASYGELRAMAFGNGELLLQFSGAPTFGFRRRPVRKCYACNLEAGTFRKFETTFRSAGIMCAHFPTFVSLDSGNS